MSWSTVSSHIDFYRPGDAWGDGVFTQFSAGDEATILSALQSLYNGSQTAHDALELVAGSSAFYVGQTNSGTPGLKISDSVVGYNLSAIGHVEYFNDHGVLTPEITGISLIHEIIHAAYGTADVIDTSEAGLNATNAEQQGATVAKQNVVATEMGWTSNIQPSYLAGFLSTAARATEVQTGVSYTEDHQVDIVRLGDDSNEVLDHSSNTINVRDLMLGLAGDDIIRAGAGDDYLYGGAGNDTLEGGDGNDRLYGGSGHDSLSGGDGNDTLHAGVFSGDPSSGSGGTDTLAGGAGNDSIDAGDGLGVKLQGGDGNDYLLTKSFQSTIDSGHGDDVIDARLPDADIFVDGVTIKFAAGDGHDYIVDPPDEAIATIDMSSLALSQITIQFDKTFTGSEVQDDDGVPRWDIDRYEGDAVIRINDGTTLYIGNINFAHFHDRWGAEGDTDYFDAPMSPDLKFSDQTINLTDLYFEHPDQFIYTPVSAYLHAPDNWAT